MEYKLNKPNHYLRITQDEDYRSPDDWKDTDIFLVYDHRQFTIERDGFNPIDIYNYLVHTYDGTLDDDIKDYSDYWIFPVYAYIHSGVSLSLGKDRYPFNCGWDTSMKGFILVKKDVEVDVKKFTTVTEEKAEKDAEALIHTWNTYLSEEVYSFVVVEKIDNTEYITNLIIDQFDKTTYLSKQGREFASIMIKDILSKNLVHDEVIEEEKYSCSGFYNETTQEDMINCMLLHTNYKLYEE